MVPAAGYGSHQPRDPGRDVPGPGAGLCFRAARRESVARRGTFGFSRTFFAFERMVGERATGLAANVPSDALSATANAASPLTRASQWSSRPLRFPLSVSFSPRGILPGCRRCRRSTAAASESSRAVWPCTQPCQTFVGAASTAKCRGPPQSRGCPAGVWGDGTGGGFWAQSRRLPGEAVSRSARVPAHCPQTLDQASPLRPRRRA